MIQNVGLRSDDSLTQLLLTKNIHNWNTLVEYLKHLPYGRNANRNDFSLVLTEGKGTCSSKHALAKKVADSNGIEEVKLIMAIYKMNNRNTPSIGSLLVESGLEYIPEAHCYLSVDNTRIDLTTTDSTIEELMPDMFEKIEIQAEQVSEWKVEYHQNFVKRWRVDENIRQSFNQIWSVREQCIRAMENKQ